MVSRLKSASIGLLLWALVLPGVLTAATYYVDPGSGVDTNAGTSTGAAWKTLPGTRTVNDSGFLRTSWGAITTSNKIAAGDTINLKAGASMTSTQGGSVRIDSNFYGTGTAGSRITIQVSAAWGTSGNFTYNATGMTTGSFIPLIWIQGRSYFTFQGFDASNRLAIINSSASPALLSQGTSGTHDVGHIWRWLLIASNASHGANVSYQDGFLIEDSLAHDNGTIGFICGGVNDQNSNAGTFRRVESYANGAQGGVDGLAFGFGLYGCSNILYEACSAHENVRDGFDFGTTSNTNSASATVINSTSYNNGEDGFGSNGGTAGVQTFDYINVVSWGNAHGWQIYDAPIVGIYHSIIGNNNSNPSFGGNILTYSDAGFPATQLRLRNNIFYKPAAYAQIGSYTGTPTVIDSDYNIWVPRSSNTETFADYPFGTTTTYAAPPSWVGAHDKLGLAFDPGFVAVSTTVFATNDFHLASGSSPAINVGTFLTTPTGVATDRDGVARSNPPDIGAYEFGTSSVLAAPTNLRVLP